MQQAFLNIPEDTWNFIFLVIRYVVVALVKGDGRKGLFFVRKSLENNWGRGVLICKEKNAVLARYALSGMNRPMGISEYEMARQQLPDDLKKALPSTDEIEAGLNRM